ncbi:MAG: PQQ-binding-like beta-propeller repeat protein [Eggerthella sp.]|nr:PQQ-binding-like beta-propeller repeat protein [Eggerthella sp.]
MSNTTCRSHGIAQRALALFTAIALATALTPSFALAEEANNSSSIAAEQSSTAGSTNNPSTADSTANKADTTQDVSESQASGSNSAAEHTTTNSSKANAGESTGPSNANNAPDQSANSAEPANQASSTKADTVSATLKISVYGTTLVSHAFSIEKGKTVEDMLNLAVEQGYINSYSHGTPYPGYTAYYVNSITVNGVAYTQPANYSEYWSSTINGAWESDGINGNKIETDGFSYELSYVSNDSNTKYDNGTGNYPTSPNAPHPDKATGSDTTSYVKNEGNTSAATSAPTSSNNAALSWKKTYGNGNYSEILTLGDSIYFASSLLNADWTAQPAVLHCLNSKGEEIGSLQLFGAIDSTCRMAYTDGVIIIPLSNGRLQGVSASEMKTLWVSGAIASGAQNISTVTASGGMVFTGTANSLDSSYNATTGTFFGINAITGERVWANEEANTGFYWSGACKVGNVLLYGNDAGVLTAVDPATGKTVSTLKLSSAIRSTVISNSAETEAYVTTNDGTLHKISVAPNGSLSELNSASFASKSTSTATLFQDNLFVGGGAADYTGTLSVVDAATMQIKHSVSLPFEVKSAPLVAKAADGNTYAYFTCNGAEGNWPDYTSGGGAWVYCLETNTVTKLFDATGSMANWCTKSIAMGADGTLYWTNDSGTLFALASAASSSNGSNSDNTQTPEKPGTNNQQNNKASNSNAGEHAPAATPISAGSASAVAQAPLSDAEALAENEASDEEKNGSAVTSASSARGTSSNNSNDSKGAPWLPIAGIVAGCAGLVAVGAFLFRRRSL